MKLFTPEHIKYLYELAQNVGAITIEPDFFIDLIIDPGNDRGRKVSVNYDGDPIAIYPFTPSGIASGLAMLQLAQKMEHEQINELRQKPIKGLSQ